MNAETIKEFLVSLGFQVDESGARKFESVLTGTTLQAIKTATAVEAAALSVVAYTAKIASGLDNLYWASQRTGATVAGIQQIGYAVSQMGGSVEGARGSLENLSRFMRNNPGAESFLNRLGVQTRDASGNMRDMASIFTGVGNKLNTMPYYRANQFAQMFGIDENTLMAMRRGVGQFSAQYSQMAKAIGYNADTAAVSSNKFMTSLRSFGQMASMVRDKIGSNLAGGLSGSIDNLRKQILDNFPKIEDMLTRSVNGLLWLAGVIGQVIYRLIQAAGDIKTWWDTLGSGTKQLIELFGGLVLAWRVLNSEFLASPIGIITALAAGILLLYDDYKTWKEGGKSLIDWAKWQPDIDAAIKNIDDLKSTIKEVATQAAILFGIDPKSWSLKWEFSNLTGNLGELAKMLKLIGDLLNAINEGRWSDAASIGKQLLKQGDDEPDALPSVTDAATQNRNWLLDKYFQANDAVNSFFTLHGGNDGLLPSGGLAGGEPDQHSQSARYPKGIRNNNAGNLRFAGQAGAVNDGTGFARFSSAFDGLRAMARQLLLYGQRGINTVSSIISKWAPAGENNTAAYIAAISRAIGVAPDAVLNLSNPQVLSALMGGIVQHENGRNPYAREVIGQAATVATGGASLHQETHINIHGVSDPREAGKVVAERQEKVNSNVTQQLNRGNS